jgi:hypothetical protein
MVFLTQTIQRGSVWLEWCRTWDCGDHGVEVSPTIVHLWCMWYCVGGVVRV